MSSLAPSSSTSRRKFNDRMKWYFNGHTFFNGGVSKVRDQYLENTHMANNKCGDDLLFKLHNNRLETSNNVLIGFSSRKSC